MNTYKYNPAIKSFLSDVLIAEHIKHDFINDMIAVDCSSDDFHGYVLDAYAFKEMYEKKSKNPIWAINTLFDAAKYKRYKRRFKKNGLNTRVIEIMKNDISRFASI